ncbi:uncharacterized protein BX663DRAFT_528132 [Cokeromyces recurvatus]|uniref:uncharacterized protein n=1 Tax=Cokeromyces recurvatus TaxID=90255 RepID=UPI0022200BB7|nr:uncharacterized protein BX663DRAFT_528132 [Cokeromyces recurvatus]KAI7897487.1 hypothetical protein BX663DRAFT_528132 [Cokeromyces recurvatus]
MHSKSNEEIEEAIAILEEETTRRIEDLQHRIEFICASLRAQGNTQINKMLMSVRQLTVKEFCEYYEADTQKFLEQQAKQRIIGGGGFEFNNRKQKLGCNGSSYMEVKDLTEKKKRRLSSPIIEKVDEMRDEESKGIEQKDAEPMDEQHEDIEEENMKEKDIESDIEVEEATKEMISTTEENKVEIMEPLLSEETQSEENDKNVHRQHVLKPLLVHLTRQDHPEITIHLDPEETADKLGKFTVEKPSEEAWVQLNDSQKLRIREQIQVLKNELDSLIQSLS